MIAVMRGSPPDVRAAEFEIEYEDVFHLKNLYKRIYDWFISEGWRAADTGEPKDFEVLYSDRTRGEATEHHMWWRAYKDQSRFIRYFLKVDIQTLNMRKTEVIHKGHKFGTNRGDVIIRVVSYVQIDYNNEWEKHPVLKYFKDIFRRRMYLDNIQKEKRDLYLSTYRLHTTIKQYLQFKPTTQDWGRSFHPEKGI